ncbi:MAG: succinyl-diaminopimelate desuccinylase [Acidimicrobiia bacterium]
MTLLDTLVELINIPSVTGDEDEICSWIESRFDGHLPTTRIGNSIIVGSSTDRAFHALYGHLDTVPVQGDPKARVDGDRLVGLGVSDMKAGIAVMVGLLEDPTVLSSDADLVCVFYDKEEGPAADNGLEAVLEANPWLVDASLSVVMEPTDLNLELGCNGVLNADIVFVGSAAHAARPWLGTNAVTRSGDWLAKMHRMEPVPVEIDGLVFREVFTVTQAHGGIANNVIPSEFTINLNHRFPPVYTLEEAEERLRRVASDADRVLIKDRAPAGTVDADNPALRRLEAIVGGGRVAKQAWTDVARLTARGASAVNYGPGEVAQAHQVGESMRIENLAVAYDAMRAFLTG